MRRRTRNTGADGQPVSGDVPEEQRSPEYVAQVAEIEQDRRAERKLLLQSLIALLVVIVLVVSGQLLFPG